MKKLTLIAKWMLFFSVGASIGVFCQLAKASHGMMMFMCITAGIALRLWTGDLWGNDS